MYNQFNNPNHDTGARLNTTERFVRDCMKAYKPCKNPRVWVPLGPLYRQFRIAFARRRNPMPGDDDVLDLTISQFGAVLNVLYPECPKVKRRVAGKMTSGRMCLDGPHSERTVHGDPSLR